MSRKNTQARYIFEPEYFGNRLIKVSGRIVNTPGINANQPRGILNFSNYFRKEIIRLIKLENPNLTPYRIRNKVKGYLSADKDDGSSSAVTHRQQIKVKHINIDEITQMLSQSEQLVEFYKLKWSYIINRNSLEIGAGGKILKQPSYSKKFKETWKEQEYKGIKLNCGLFSICSILYKNEKFLIKEKTSFLMTKLDIGESCSIEELGNKFIKFYENYRITFLILIQKNSQLTTFKGNNFIYNKDNKDNILYLIYDGEQNHFAATTSPTSVYRLFYNSSQYKYCDQCTIAFTSNNGHECIDEENSLSRKRKKYTCKECNKDFYNFKDHVCYYYQCKTCMSFEKIGDNNHRCLLLKDSERAKKYSIWKKGDPEDGSKFKLFAFDFESSFELNFSEEELIDFKRDENGRFKKIIFTDENNKIKETVEIIRINTKSIHKVNLICYKDIYNDEETKVVDTIENFVDKMLSINKGKNICIAHNASGYDSRLIYEQAVKFILPENIEIKTITRGNKFMKLTIGNTIFIDSLLHLKGRLKDLAKSYSTNIKLEKGYFPYLFNSNENLNYIGEIPSKKYFDLSFSIKNENEFQDFNNWYNERKKYEWDFKKELKLYCINDVEVLSEIIKQYNEIKIEIHGLSPWFNVTAASYIHEVYLREVSKKIDLPLEVDNELYRYKVQEAIKENWVVLLENEYHFARLALRGGRTDVRSTYYKVSEQDYLRGVRIRYIDVVSLYPFCQIKFDYPVGIPSIYVYDKNFIPCRFHPKNIKNVCDCNYNRKIDSRLNYEYFNICNFESSYYSSNNNDLNICNNDLNTIVLNQLKKENFFGIICCTLKPPKGLYHPVLPLYDEETLKCVYSLEEIKEKVFTTIEFKKAIEKGYELIKVHRVDIYKKKESLWSKKLKRLYIEKIKNSSKQPSIKEQERLIYFYEKEFQMGELIKESFMGEGWDKRSAKKLSAKIDINSIWGKHCERINLLVVELIKETDKNKMRELYQNFSNSKLQLINLDIISKDKLQVKFKNDDIKPDLHRSYLPAGLFVPAYGRLVLYEQLEKLDKRVLMHDTDSIIYVYDPELYNPIENDILGSWLREDIDKNNDGIIEYVGLGPKSYGLKCLNGETQFKCKGVSMSLANTKIFNFNTLKDLVLENIKSVEIPQFNFIQGLGKEMKTYNFLKEIKFHKGKGKGIYIEEEKRIYPYGYF
jgi:hypothetical protein